MDIIDNFIQDRLNQGLDMGINKKCLDHLNNIKQIYTDDESLEHYAYDYIEVQIWKSIHLPKFESQPDNEWSQVSFPTFDASTLEPINRNINIYPNRYKFQRRVSDNFNVFNLLRSNQTENDQDIHLYHGSDIQSIEQICQYGINLFASHRLGSDFGPGFYVTQNFDGELFRIL